jgi:hypothetical protein
MFAIGITGKMFLIEANEAFGIVIPNIVCIVDIAYIDLGRFYALLLDFE